MARDYTDLGLNANLRSLDSLAVRQRGAFDTGYDFVTQNERGAIARGFIDNAAVGTAEIIDASITNAKMATASIGTANIGTLSFNEISGGTANLGGTNDGNGLLSLKNSAGVEIVKLSNIGIGILGSSNVLAFGSSSQADAYYSQTFGLTIENTADGFGTADIRLTTDTGNVILYAWGTLQVTLGSSHIMVIKRTTGGTLMTLNGSSGDLKIAGTLGTGISF